MAVKTVNAQGYDAVMAVKSMAAASPANRANFVKNANAANSGMQGFGAMLNKAGERTAGIANDAQASKLKNPAIQADKGSAGKESPDVKAAEESAKAVENGQAVTDKKLVGEAKAAEAKAAEGKAAEAKTSEAKTEEAKTSEVKTEEAKTSEAKTEEAKTSEAKMEEANAEKAKPEEAKALGTADAAKTGESKEEPDNMTMAHISDALMQIIGQIKELLGVSDAELLIGLEKADLQLVDLLNPANMSKLLTEVAGEGNVMSLVTNGELYSKLQELTKTVGNVSSQLLDELGLTQEEFDAMLEKSKLDKIFQPENADALKNAALNPQDALNAQTRDAGAATENKADDIAPETEAKLAPENEAAAKTEADAKPAPEIKPATEAKPVTGAATEAKPIAEDKTEADAKSVAENEAAAKTEADAKPAADDKIAADAKPAPEIKPATEAKPMTEDKIATEAKPIAEDKTEADAKPAADDKTAAEAKPVTGAATEAKPVTDAETKADASTKLVNENEKPPVNEEAKAAAKEDAATPVQVKQPEKTAAEDADARSAIESSAAKKQAEATVQNQQNAAINVVEQQAKADNQNNLPDAQARSGQDSKKDKSDMDRQPNAQAFDGKLNAAQTMATTAPEALQTAAETLARYTSENTQSILRQLADIVRVARNENLTQMEMQLHPASLGTVNVSLVTKGGAVTAHFTTQNEAVKAAVEAQAVQLVSNLEAQGVKVEAVEVTVAGHQLEKNLDENSRNEQSRQEREESQRIQGSRRNSINLNAYADDEEMLEEMQGADDATRIAMELMAANGNSMDLMA